MHLPEPATLRHDLLDADRVDDRVLVVVFLRGGADGMTLVPPIGDDAYHRARPMLAVRREDAIDLDGYFALHADLDPLLPRFRNGELGIVHGAGSEDDTRSHFEAQDTMEHGGAHGSGWLGRYLRAGRALGALGAVSIGTTRPESMRGAPMGVVMQTVRDFDVGGDEDLLDRLAKLYAAERGPLGGTARATVDAVRRLRALRADGGAPAEGAVYPQGNFGRGLREIARLVKADVGLVATTIDLGGWDTHFVQGRLIGGLMRQLATGIDAFGTDLGAARSRVTVVVMTEFGRRLRENTSFGTDHGAGGVMMVVGDAAAATGLGGRVIPGWSDLSPGNLDEVGDVPAAINYRDVLWPVLQRHRPGVDLADVFPGHAQKALPR